MEGLRVLVVEDELMVWLELQDILRELGCDIAGSAAHVAEARALAQTVEFDLAVLDLNLCGERTDEIADLLAARGIPFIFATGYGQEGVAQRHRNVPIIEKPYTTELLRMALIQLAAGLGARGEARLPDTLR
jgi:CheY-like chemotaxis protein